MPVFWLNPYSTIFPDPTLADEEGILAIGGDLSTPRLIRAYSEGIFPWYNEGEPILWWSPDPRMILFPDELKVSKSMRPLFNQHRFEVTINRDFEAVMRHCMQTARVGQTGSWINEKMIAAYKALYTEGWAHSVEVWDANTLVAGLYGVAIGKVFFGESMFTHVSNGSKYGFIWFVEKLKKQGFKIIDCQQETRHLTNLGGRTIPRNEFLAILATNTVQKVIME